MIDNYPMRWFNYYNRKYWHSRLPQNTVVEWSNKLSHPDISAQTYIPGFKKYGREGWHKVCGPKPKVCTIRLHPLLNKVPPYALMVLLHEMVHLEAVLGDRWLAYHGKRFNRRMKQIIDLGAFTLLW